MSFNNDDFFNHSFSFLIVSLIIGFFSGPIATYPDTEPQLIEVGLNLCLEGSVFIFMYCMGYFYSIGNHLTREETERLQIELMVFTMFMLILMSLGSILTSFNQHGLGLEI